MKVFIGQVLALITFFGFPMIQYIILKLSARREGIPELWYLPAYGFRLVIRNLPRKKQLFDIKYRCILRRVVPKNEGSSVSTYDDYELLSNEDFFLFAGTDQVLLSFQIRRDGQMNQIFVLTDKLGNEIDTKGMSDFDSLIADYTATVDNFFHFDIRISKRVEISRETLVSILEQIERKNTEQRFQVTRVRNVG